MKKIISTFGLAASIFFITQAGDILVNQAPNPISASVYNDSSEQISVRIRFRNNELYWSHWEHIPAGNSVITLTAKHPEDSIFGFAMLGEQAALIAASKQDEGEQAPTGRVYLLSDFRSDSGKQFNQIGENIRITIRDNKIEVSANLPDEKMFWTGEFSR